LPQLAAIPQPFPADRFEHALEIYAFFHGRECQAIDIARFLEQDTRLYPDDHLLAVKLSSHSFRIIGVVTEGCSIVDTTDGPPNWAIRRNAGRSYVQPLHWRERRLRTKLEALDILEGPG
jgi:hypothetical protein